MKKINELLEMNLQSGAVDEIEALLLRWGICNDEDIADLAERIPHIDSGSKEMLRESLFSLAHQKAPFRLPSRRSFTFKKGNNEVDTLPEAARPFLYRGYKILEVFEVGAPPGAKNLQSLVRSDDFRAVLDETYRLVISKNTVEYEDLISPFDGKPLGPLEPLDASWAEVKSAQIKTGKRQSQVPPRILWTDPRKMPKPGTQLELILEYDPAGLLSQEAQAKFIPAGLQGTEFISPLGLPLLQFHEIFQRPEEWNTIVRFSVRDRVREFIPISVDTKLVDFRKAISKKARSPRDDGLPTVISVEDIESMYAKKSWWFVPFSLAIESLDYKDNEAISQLWFHIELDLLLRLGFHPRTPHQKTRTQLAAVEEIEKKAKNRLVRSKYQAAADSVAASLGKGTRGKVTVPDTDWSAPDPNDPEVEAEAFIEKQVQPGYARNTRARKRARKIKESLDL